MDQDEIDIIRFTDLSADGVQIDYTVHGNPFKIVPTNELLKSREDINLRLQTQQNTARRRSVLQRVECARPRVQPFETWSTRAKTTLSNRKNAPSSKKISESIIPSDAAENINMASFQANNEILPQNDLSGANSARRAKSVSSTSSNSTSPKEKEKPNKKVRTRKLTMHEFIDEKREIYRLQLFIDKKNKEMRRFITEMEKSEKRIKEAESKMDALSDQYKMASVKIDAAVARRKKIADAAKRATSDKKRELQKVINNQQVLRSECAKKEVQLETYQAYHDFLMTFIRTGESIENKFVSPSVLVEELHNIENENLFLMSECQNLEYFVNSSTNNVINQLEETKIDEEHAHDKLNTIQKVQPFKLKISKEQLDDVQEANLEFERLSRLIRRTYSRCISADADLKPITMLERLENTLESMYKTRDSIDPAFVEEKQTIKLKLRREMQRKAKQEKRAHEQKLKMEQAIERAKKPIPQKIGRPIHQRIIPVKSKVKDNEKERQKLLELEKEYNLLYGPIE